MYFRLFNAYVCGSTIPLSATYLVCMRNGAVSFWEYILVKGKTRKAGVFFFFTIVVILLKAPPSL